MLIFEGFIHDPDLESLKTGANQLSLVEAASLFDHLTYRYDTMYLTNIFVSIVHDLDFRIVLELGLARLNKQIDTLEKQLKRFLVPFPKRPAMFSLDAQGVRFFDDDTIFRTINSFMQGAGNKHAQAFKQATHNDDIREFFKDLLIEEMDVFDDFIKFGTLRGWLNPIPKYLP